jgi:hypothetical protein
MPAIPDISDVPAAGLSAEAEEVSAGGLGLHAETAAAKARMYRVVTSFALMMISFD